MLDYKSIIVKRYALHLSGREIAKQIGASKSGVNEFLKMFEELLLPPLPVSYASRSRFHLSSGQAHQGIHLCSL